MSWGWGEGEGYAPRRRVWDIVLQLHHVVLKLYLLPLVLLLHGGLSLADFLLHYHHPCGSPLAHRALSE